MSDTGDRIDAYFQSIWDRTQQKLDGVPDNIPKTGINTNKPLEG